MIYKKILISLSALVASVILEASPQPSFLRVESGDMVFCLFQDSRGMVWTGTQYGLASFNGVSFDHRTFYLPEPAPKDMRVNCSLSDGVENCFVGTSCGLFRLNIRTMQAEKVKYLEDLDIRSLCRMSLTEYVICTSTGLFMYDTKTSEVTGTGIKTTCSECVKLEKDSVLVCSSQGACIFNKGTRKSYKLEMNRLPSDGVLSAASDMKRGCIWLGTNGLLYRYDRKERSCSSVQLPSNKYKSLLVESSGMLMCGTENGLLIYNPDSRKYSIEKYNAKDYSSLSGNVVWSLMEDDAGNIWAGTNKGVSVWRRNSPVTVYDWDDLTGTEQENNLFCITGDRSGKLWTGGDAGAVAFSELGGGKVLSYFNKKTVRCITVDDDGDLWIAADGGINLLNRKTGKFKNYIIRDRQSEASAHKVYDIADDHKGNLWVATYESGAFVVDKKSLKSSPEGQFYSDVALSIQNGRLEDNTVGKIVPGYGSEMWMLMTNLGLLRYDTANGTSRLFSPASFSSSDPLKNMLVLADAVWVGTLGGLYRLDAATLEYRYIPMPKMAYANPIAAGNGTLWVLDGEILVAVDLNNYSIREMNLGCGDFSCGIILENDRIVLGGKGKLAVVSLAAAANKTYRTRLFITDIRFNGTSAGIHENPDYLESVEVPYGKDLEIAISTAFFQNCFNNIEYSLDGESSWTGISKSCQSISFAGLHPGRHQLCFRCTDDGRILKKVEIRILNAWQLRWYMFIVYLIVILLLILLIKSIFRARERRKAQREQMEKIRRITNIDSLPVKSDKAFIEKLNECIEKNLSNDNLDVNFISEYLQLPPKQVYRKIKAIAGLSIVEYVRNYKLKKAALYLRNGKMPIPEIMERVGFSSLAYFTKCFKKQYGTSPKAYRKK